MNNSDLFSMPSQIATGRFHCPDRTDLESVGIVLSAGRSATVVFGGAPIKPPFLNDAGYLPALDELCAKYPDKLIIELFTAYGESGHLRILDDLPHLRVLRFISMEMPDDLDVFAVERGLKDLHFSIYKLTDKSILNRINANGLERLFIGDTTTKALDLSPLANFHDLKHIGLSHHRKNIEAITSITRLKSAALSPNAKTSYSFLNDIKHLHSLSLSMGSLNSISDLLLPKLQELSLVRVRGLSDLGDLTRFRTIRELIIADQAQLSQIVFAKPLSDLRVLFLENCKKLSRLEGLQNLTALESLSIVRTALDFRNFDFAGLTPSCAHLMLRTGRHRADSAMEDRIRTMGFSPSNEFHLYHLTTGR